MSYKSTFVGFVFILLQTILFAKEYDSLRHVLTSRSFSNSLEHFELLIKLNHSIRVKDTDSAYIYLHLADSIAQELDNDSLKAETAFNLGIAHSIIYQYDSAQVEFLKAIPHYKKTKNYPRLAYSYRNLGIANRGLGKLVEATEYLYESLSMYLDLEDSLMINLVYFDIGNVAYSNNQLDLSEEMLLKCLPYFKADSTRKRNLAVVLNGLGLINEQKIDGSSGLPYFEEALINYGYFGDSLAIAQVYNNIGMHYLNDGFENPDSALLYLNRALRIFNAYNNTYSKPAILINKGIAFNKKGNVEKAIFHITEGILLAESGKEYKNHITGLRHLRSIYQDQGEFEKAFIFTDSLRKVEADFNSLEKTSRLEEIHREFSLERKELENIRLKKEQLSQQRVIEKQELINLLLVLLVGTVIIFAIVIYAWYLRLKSGNKKLMIMKKELEIKSSNLEKINESKSQLIKIIGHDLRSPVGNTLTLLQLIEPEEENKEEHLLAIQSATNSLYLLNNLMEWINTNDGAHLSADVSQPISISRSLKRCHDMFHVFSQLKGVRLKFTANEDFHVIANEDMMDTVLRNLVSNAYKFTPKGGSVELRAFREFSKIRIQVIDSGTGMDAATLQSILEHKKVKSQAGTNSEKGSGLGLTIVHSLLEKMDSQLEISTEIGVGSTFSFVLKEAQ